MKNVEKLAKDIREFLEPDANEMVSVDEIEKIISKHCPPVKPFPKHMKCEKWQHVVLFYKPKVGIIQIPRGVGYPLGFKSDTWHMKSFKDCEIGVIE